MTAEGDSIAASLIAKALSDVGEGLIELRRIEAAEEIAKILSESPNVAYIADNANMLLNAAGLR